MPKNTLAERIAASLRRDILRGKLRPGSPIKERDNAAELGVSRTPMREAIRILAKEGLVELRPARSPIVAQPGFKEVEDQAAVLIALEKLSVELACLHATETDLTRIQALVQRMSDTFDHTDPLDMFELDMEFHSAIAEASHNQPLVNTHRQYLQKLWRARYIAASQRRNRERVVCQHSDIVTALRERNPSAALAAIDMHLHHLAEDVREVIELESENAQSA
ncbi:MAG TPA: GntR family transcriptional regulator [Marinobacterium sp.]|nr:GntR family transcriptional regulator [Marinobacterium sp.]